MSPLKAKLTEDMKQAMRDHDAAKLGTIRFLLSEIKNFEIDNGEQPDEGIIKVIAREVKKLKDALVDFTKAGRQDLIDEETAKIKIMEAYLPQQMSDEELKALVQAAIQESATKDFGSIMKSVMVRTHGQADGARVSKMVMASL